MFRKKPDKRQDFSEQALPHLSSLYGAAYRLTRSQRDAEDLVQEAMLRAFRFWDSFQKGSNCKAWLFRILTNTFINSYQKRRRAREILDAASSEQSATDGVLVHEASLDHVDPQTRLVDNSFSDEVSAALDTLPPEFRMAIVLCDVEGFSYKEISDIMECPVGTVMSRLHRARRLMRSALHEFALSEGIIRDDADVIDMTSYRKREA